MKHIVLLLFSIYCFQGLFSQSSKYTISGYVSDAVSGEKLINANVYNPQDLTGAVSNIYGFYSLTLPAGKYIITYSYVGYTAQHVTIDLNSDKTININLEATKSIEEVTVMASSTGNKMLDTQMSKEVITMETVKTLPAFMGEADIVKTLQLLPGVQSGSEASTGLYVRGGGPDQNLVLLDGVPVYNANHLFGFFSVFNPDAIKNVSLYKGGFPARFGGRLSSVVDIRMKEGNEKDFHGGFHIGVVSSKIYAEGPIQKDKTAFHFSARRTYIDVLTKPFMDKELGEAGYYFYDLNAKVNHKFSDKSRFYLSAYTGKDKAYSTYEEKYQNGHPEIKSYKNTEEADMYWGNVTTAARWNYIISKKIFSNTTITYSRYNFNIKAHSEYIENDILTSNFSYHYRSGIDDISAKVEFDWYPNHNHSVKFGANYIDHSFSPGVETFNEFAVGVQNISATLGADKTYATEISTFIEDDVNIGTLLKVNLGVHTSGFFVNDAFYHSIEPRIGTRLILNDQITIKAAYSKMQQYLHLLSNSSIGLPTDLWLPVTDRIKPQKSHQYAIGGIYSPSNIFTYSAEGFYKTMNNVLEYKEGATFFGSSTGWEDKVFMGEAIAYGFELLARKEVGKTTGWMGYTWSKSERYFEELSQSWFPAKYDRRHDVSIVFSHRPNDKIDFGATWVYGTGTTFTLSTHEIATLPSEYIPNWRPHTGMATHFEGRNNYRMPDYHRLDIGINFHKKKKRGTRTWNISIYNVYNRKNAFYLYLGYDDEGNKALKQISLFPILPSVSYSYNF